jgi:hypothetical protein
MKLGTKLLASASILMASMSSYAAEDLTADFTQPVAELNAFNMAMFAGDFLHGYTFSFTETTDASSTLGSISFFGTPLTVSIYSLDSTFASATLLGSVTTTSVGPFGSLFGYAALGETFVSGDYGLTVAGSGIGFYGIESVASPVPEASTLSLMLAGFGVVGLMSYRRRTNI